jgi:hypothetical protein
VEPKRIWQTFDESEKVKPINRGDFSFWYRRNRWELTHPAWWPLAPIVPVGIYLLGLVVGVFCSQLHPNHTAFSPETIQSVHKLGSFLFSWQWALISVLAPVALSSLILVGAGLGWLAPKLAALISNNSRWSEWWEARRAKGEAGRRALEEARIEEAQRRRTTRLKIKGQEWELPTELTELVCTGRPRPLSVRELPRERRTVELRFWDLKRRVCRPFAAK